MARKLVANQDNTSTSSQTEPLTRAVARPIFGESVLAIDYNFAEKDYLDDDITFSRSSGATQTNSSGLVAYAPENGIKKSSQLDTWGKLGTNNTTVTAATDITDPLGGNGAFRVTTDTANVGGIYLDLNDQVTKNNNTTVQSIYIRSVSGTKTTHVITHNSSSKGLVTITEEWQRIVIPYDSTLTAATNFYGVDFRDSDTDATDVYLFAPQVSSSLTGEAVEYVPTTTDFVYKERFDYTKDGDKKGLLIEEQRTNSLTQSIDLTGYASASSFWLANADISPSGIKDADRLYEESDTDTYHRLNYTASTSANTLSFYAKKGAVRDWVYTYLYSGSAEVEYAFFNLATGQVGTTSGLGGYGMEDVGNGWYRCWVYRSTAGYNTGRIGLATSDNDFTYDGDTSAYVSLWGLQEEVGGSFPTSLIPTYGATASRSADIASVSGTAFSRFFKDTEGAVVVDFQLHKDRTNLGFKRLISFSDGTTANSLDVYGQNNFIRAFGDNASSGYLGLYPTTIEAGHGEITKIGVAYKDNDFSLTGDGGSSTTDTSGIVPRVFNRLSIGSQHNGIPINSWIRRLRYFNKRKSDAQVQKLTDTSFLLDKFKDAKAAHSLRSLRDGRDNSPVTRIRREYDSYEADYTAAQVSNGELENDFKSEKQTTLPLDVSVEADEMVVNGTFDTTTAPWGISTGGQTVELSGGGIRISTDGTMAYIAQDVSVVKGKTYRITGDINITSGAAYGGAIVFLGVQTDLTSSQSFSFDLVATSTSATSTFMVKRRSGGGATDFIIDNISVKEVNPIGTGFSTRKINSDYTGYAMRVRNNDDNIEAELSFDSNNEISLDSPVKATSMNLLAHSENFGEWSLGNSPERIGGLADPYGGNNAWSIRSASGGAYHHINHVGAGTISITPNSTYTFSWYVKKETSKTNFGGVGINLFGGTSKWGYIIVDEVNGTAVDSSGSGLGTPHIEVTEPITGWWRVAVTVTDAHSNNSAQVLLYSGFSSNGSDLAPVAGSARTIFGAQLEETQYSSTGTEKITDGGFDNGLASWVAGGDSSLVSVENGAIRINSPDSVFTQIYQDSPVTAGKKYVITADLTVTSGGVAIGATQNSAGTEVTYTSSGSISQTFVATSTSSGSSYYIKRSGAANVLVDNVSVLEYDPELQSYTQTPVISDAHNSTSATNLREFAGKENLLTYSEDFSNGVWTKSGVTATPSNITDPFGGTNSFSVIEDTANSTHALIRGTRPTLQAGVHTLSLYLKSNGKTVGRLLNNGTSGSGRIVFDLTNKTTTVESGPVVGHSITELDNGWFRVSMDFTAVVGTSGISVYLQGTGGSWTGDGESGFYVFGMQLNTNSLKDYQKTTSSAKTADVHVVNWYDQGGGEDFIQDTATRQPRIVMGSELVTDSGGKASVYFDGGDNLINESLAGQNRLDSYIAIEPDLDADDSQVLLSGNSSDYIGLIFDDGNSSQEINKGSGNPLEFINGTQLAANATRNDVHDKLGSTSVFSLTDATTSSFTTFQMGWNNSAGSSLNYQGNLSEMVFFPNMDSSPKRFNIEQNMMNHFDVNIVTNGTFETTSNWFTQGNATIDTSTNLATIDGTSQTSYIVQGVVEEGKTYILTFDVTSDNGTGNRWITNNLGGSGLYYNITGNGSKSVIFTHSDPSTNLFFTARNGGYFVVSNIKLQEYGVSGFVTTLYDQTGNNNHALQSTAANQPQIVSGGDLIKSGNHPAWEFTNTSPTFHNLELFGKLQVTLLDAWFVADTAATRYLYPADFDDSANFGWVAEDNNSSTSLIGNYGVNADARLYVNNQLTAQHGVNSRDAISTALVGRKLVHHQNNGTGAWDKVMVGWYGGGQAVGGHRPYFYEGKMSEMIWYDSSQSSNRTSIDTAINTHYNIY